jgi:hypothetical protein
MYDIHEGTELTLSYVPLGWQYKMRNEQLNEEFGFTCNCDRCKQESHWGDEEEEEDGDDDDNDEKHGTPGMEGLTITGTLTKH